MSDENTATAVIETAPAPVTVAPAVSEGTPAPVVAPVAPKYLTVEDFEARAAALVAQAKETGRREMQSEKDREVSGAIRRARELEIELSTMTDSFKNLDPETLKDIELQRYRGREISQRQLDAEEGNRQAVEATINQFYTNLSEHVKELGIDPTNKSLDWGNPAESLTVRQNKFLKSVAKVQKDQSKVREDAISNRLKDETAKMRKELGLESVDRTPSVASGNTADFLQKFAAGDIPMTKDNIAKYNKLLEE